MTRSARLESLSDAAFAVAIGLLVVSTVEPKNYTKLIEVVRNAPAIGAAFAVILWLWSEHRRFFSRYEIDDVPTVFLNGLLLFLVLFYVYPLKFVAYYVIGTLIGLNPGAEVSLESASEGGALLRIYGSGFMAIFGVFALLYRRAWKCRDALGLSPVDGFDARSSLLACVLCVAVGAFSFLFTFVPGPWATAVAGFSYSLLGPVMGLHGHFAGEARKRLLAKTASPT